MEAKKQNKKLSDLQFKTERFFNKKLQKYKERIHRINEDFKKEIHLKEFDKFQKELLNKLLRLKYSQKQKYQEKMVEIEDWFNQHFQRMIAHVDRKTLMNRFPLYVYIFCSILCMTFSFIFHTFYPISKRVNDVL